MRTLWSVITLLLSLLVMASCSEAKAPAPAEPPQVAAAQPGSQPGQPGSVGEDRSPAMKVAADVEASEQVGPLSMEQVLASIDERLDNSASRRSMFGFRGRGQLPMPQTTGAPYLYVPGENATGETLPLKSTHAEVHIAGVIAQVLVTQVYQNRGKTPIEASYVFPASPRAAVHGMRMTLGKRTIVAKVRERDEARSDYEAAKAEGKRASLLEQQRANVFTMNVANIMPGEVIKTELVYSELLVPEDGTYEFVYPTVVGPRNPMGAPPQSTAWVNNPSTTPTSGRGPASPISSGYG